MYYVKARNVNEALTKGLRLIKQSGEARDSRNGEVAVLPAPCMTLYEKPWERVLLCPVRDANPFFHLFESVWMLGGRNDLASLKPYVGTFGRFSDDGHILHGAYGKRWRAHFPKWPDIEQIDQLDRVVAGLRHDYDCRRQVIAMWDPEVDLGGTGRDLPCNTHVYVQVVSGKLTITVCCRSNDMIWGAYGANAVHFSFLQQYLAERVGVPMGPMYQLSNNFHAYQNEQLAKLTVEHVPDEPYDRNPTWVESSQIKLVEDEVAFGNDLKLVLDEDNFTGTVNPWFQQVLQPVVRAHQAWRKKDDPERFDKALEVLEQCRAADWRETCVAWLQRRRAQFESKGDDK